MLEPNTVGQLHPTPTTEICPLCGQAELVFCLDYTEFYHVKKVENGTLEAVYDGHEPLFCIYPAERLFCRFCAEYFEVPEDYNLEG
mgnify:CR=1 FL=1